MRTVLLTLLFWVGGYLSLWAQLWVKHEDGEPENHSFNLNPGEVLNIDDLDVADWKQIVFTAHPQDHIFKKRQKSLAVWAKVEGIDRSEKVHLIHAGQLQEIEAFYPRRRGDNWTYSFDLNTHMLMSKGKGEFNPQEKITIGSHIFEQAMTAYAPSSFILDSRGKFEKIRMTVAVEGDKPLQFSLSKYSASSTLERIREISPEAASILEIHAYDDWHDIYLSSKAFENVYHKVLKQLSEVEIYQFNSVEWASLSYDKKWEELQSLLETVIIDRKFKRLTLASLRESLDEMKRSFPNQNWTVSEKLYQSIALDYERVKNDFYSRKENARVKVLKILKDKKTILLSNPLLNTDFVAIKSHLKDTSRMVRANALGTTANNYTGHNAIGGGHGGFMPHWYDCEVVKFDQLGLQNTYSTLYKPDKKQIMADLEMNWDGDRFLFATLGGEFDRYRVFEGYMDGKPLVMQTPDDQFDIDYADPAYLPDGKIVATSNMLLQAVPCVSGVSPTSNLVQVDPVSKKVRALNFGQDSDWCPITMPNGRLMYLRWEYSDMMHYFTRTLMHMNPDGTGKKELYGSNSYWPNSIFDARPISEHSSEFVGIVTGHHGTPRSGHLVIFDPAKGRHENEGVVQEIPFRDRHVENKILDRLVEGVWPQFLKPYPLDENYFIVTCKPTADALWGLYLVDRFDNMTLVYEEEGAGYIDIQPVRKQKVPPVIPEKVQLKDKESTVYIQDIYQGKGLKGIDRGEVKELRIFAYKYHYNGNDTTLKTNTGDYAAHGIESSWDVKRLLGRVPVEEDGSAIFKIPANTPVSLQPLDEDGRAMQLMRSWITGMPGEVVSCVGCHEDQNTIPPPKPSLASKKKPHSIQPYAGGVRPYGFELEVQPILDKKCVACHDGNNELLDFASKEKVGNREFRKSYLNLHPFVRRPGPESEVHILNPMEYHASTSDLVKMLEKGHHNVKLDTEEWERLNTWIDLNVPFHAEWRNVTSYRGKYQVERRSELMSLYANIEDSSMEELRKRRQDVESQYPIIPFKPERIAQKDYKTKHWGFDAEEAIQKQKRNQENKRIIRWGEGQEIALVKIPSGTYYRNSENGPEKVKIKKSFWMSEKEITNDQYRSIFPDHDSRYITKYYKDQISPGVPVNEPKQPVVRVNWHEANKFCQEISNKTNHKVVLPSEHQWEWAAQAGGPSDMWYGDIKDEFETKENLADKSLEKFARREFDYYNFLPKIASQNDGHMVSAPVGSYQANPWGLYDIQGNVSEWTRDADVTDPSKRIAKGGSWRDRPGQATISEQEIYKAYQKVYDVGFRVIIEE
ncbi:HzsA-related protein [Aureibacter tunicatorum]|uniref:Formylglycine-generating enzyme required for sulfatase activity n=1 Tax=Aureibacter tunicatorum TaxID=866807 RepID=A0AAE3XS64_9BACT|nr:SUMF1/EgtB/PvdO family nonheme iron enzyme [Aureibacter tunicatorum]MDR6241788.1 formylglycine-generating enzyme required for sulfatase activity [Aureibacter tunicatorum]BDD07420.1 hypothetical protein AUTU_49030 [Aureibacter tunicatorum]